jgi:hypothetical protein
MHHFIFPKKATWISSGSSTIDGTSFKDQNFGQDQILELKKEYFNSTFNYQTRILVQFDLSDISESIQKRDIDPLATSSENTGSRFYLRLYEAEGNKELSTEYTIEAIPLSQSWDEGRGKFGDDPKVTNGVSWENRSYPDGGTAVSWSKADGTNFYGGNLSTGSWNASQSFSYESPDVQMDVTNIVNGWFNKTINNGNNYGILLKFSGSQETDETTFGHTKFFSNDTHTIYPPRLEVRWNDVSVDTGSLLPLSMSGLVDNYLYMPGFRESYRENERVKFRVKPRKRYIQKTFSTSVQTLSGSFIPTNSGSYSIVDIATGETIVPFSSYTSMSCDATSNYFIQWLDGFYPDRVYKILYRLKYEDGQEQIFDNNFEFIIKR